MSGWEPKRITRYEYDDAGRVVAEVTELEPEYSRADVETLIALMESKRVGPHGHPMSEATSRDGDPNNPDRKFDWDAGLPVIDFAQQALDRAKKKFQDSYPDHDMSAYLWHVRKRYLQ